MNPETDIGYMRMALSLAERGIGWTSPNPMVGAVVVRDGKAIAEGYHPRCGEAHAERIALEKAGGQAVGATLYVTLEPCAHHGKTPPCLDCVLASGVARVVVAMEDPNPLVHGKSIQALRDNGIEVAVGICEKEARVLNYPFLSSMLRQRPWVTLKYAMTLDGKIATSTGDSKWVSGEESRAGVQDIRRRHRAILVGFRTALTDDPLLTCRETGDPPPRQPL
ncbi:MAG: bifunctional diaminohydroxyphosphoribosylaminopyrimidine deaminase/5-amino-6-(5-phosphoribosylamino)uracil reductase RibD, partial [Candidatus Omnitrophica bacterium]|nr:bifunctional diaminohydroxyphosphoribosylaminopyrimidine deaminase/5-amino-6-(5-phosphoribosylamino)uracil reductase RibD [Candidatus Omnitrophota bacterium]